MTGGLAGRKQQLRAAALAARERLTAAARDDAGDAITAHGVAQLQNATTIAAYFSVGTEPPTVNLLDALVGHGVRILLPVIDDLALDWAPYTGVADMAAGPLGLNEPITPRLGVDALADVDLVLVPALVVDRHGNRLGRGRGFYDRALIEVAAPIVAVLYDDELVDDVPAEPHDARIDAVLRPMGLTHLR